MNITKLLDMAIAADEIQKYGYESGYVVGNQNPNRLYLSTQAFREMVTDMQQNYNFHYLQYQKADGGELKEKENTPPKMAAFASSSRMIYMLSKDKPGFVFEEKLPTRIGGKANMDGYLENDEKCIYVESKCHEPYSHTGKELISTKYKKVYEYLSNTMGNAFSCDMETVIRKDKTGKECEKLRVNFFCEDRKIPSFDIKQMICHLLGIANRHLARPCDKEILFLYLLYNPSHLNLESREEIMRIYNDTCTAANDYHIKEMFDHIVDFLVREKKYLADGKYVEKLKSSFDFKLCDQNDYHTCF